MWRNIENEIVSEEWIWCFDNDDDDALEFEWRVLTTSSSSSLMEFQSIIPVSQGLISILIYIRLVLECECYVINFHYFHDDDDANVLGSMWMMKLGPSETMDSESYPQRPGESDCSYYIKTGLCRFGVTCRFNHPPSRKLVCIIKL
jgi:hypothetical protein